MKVVLIALAGLVMGAGVCGGCASGERASQGSPRVVNLASEAQTEALLNRLKSLEGEWTTKDGETGETVTASVFRVTSAGSAVREVMFPGTPHEMTNVYHMDGPSLVMTHYCAAGNQPRMRATGAEGNTIPFQFDSVTNMTSPDETYMGRMTLEFKDADTVVEHWVTMKDGNVVPEHSPMFVLTRKR